MPTNKEIRTAIRKGITKPSQGASHQFWSIYNILNAIVYNKKLNKRQIQFYTRLSPVTVQRVLTMCEEKKLVKKEVKAHNAHVYSVQLDKAKQFLISLFAWRTIKTMEFLDKTDIIRRLKKIQKNLPDYKLLKKLRKDNRLYHKYKKELYELLNLYGEFNKHIPFTDSLKYARKYKRYRYKVRFLVNRGTDLLDAIKNVEKKVFSSQERYQITILRRTIEGITWKLGTIEQGTTNSLSKDERALLNKICR